jgi:signal transduction histidine kinase/streptogramin lyase
LVGDQEGDLWIGDCVRGLLRLKDGRLTSYLKMGLREDGIQALFVDSEDALWIGTSQEGLYRLKDGKLNNYRTGNGLADNDVNYITGDHKGSLWLGTSAGISRFKHGEFTNYQTQGLAAVRDICVAADGTLWIGTYGYGLVRFRDGKFVQITSKNGLFDDFISDILEDNRGNFWMSGNKGIFRVSEKDLTAFADGQLPSITSVSYGVQDGMQTSEANGTWNPSAWKMRDGKLWFAMIRGLVIVDPSVTDSLPPPVVINKTVLNGRPLPAVQPVRILPGQRNLEIHYAAITFTRPRQVQFKYKLTGLDQSWVNAGTRRTAYFPDLTPGKYTFTVIAENGEGVWNTTGASLGIVVVPPYWRTWWFLSLVLLTLAMAGAGAYHLRVASLKKATAMQEEFSRQLLASQEAERQRIAAALHDSLGQSLLIIKNRADLALASREDNEMASEQLDEISSAASHAVEEVRVIAHDLRPYYLDRFGLTKTLQAICDQASRSCGIPFSTDLDVIDGLFSKEAETNIYRIIQEAINNIIRHSQLTIRRQGREIRLRIHDNGKGFGPTPSGTVQPRAGGFDLVGLAERVRMLGGSYSIESAQGQGATLTIRLVIPGGSDEG